MKPFSLLLLLGATVTSTPLGAQIVVYNNTTNFTNSGLPSTGTVNPIVGTTVVADDLSMPLGAGLDVGSVTFSIVNFNASAVTARPNLLFWMADGDGGGPGTLLASIAGSSTIFTSQFISLLSVTLAPGQLTIPTNGQLWAGVFFDSATATVAEVRGLGQGIYNPPTVGSSADLYWFSQAPGGANAENNPIGSLARFTFGPVANFGWRFQTFAAVPEPSTVAATFAGVAMIGVFVLRRRRAAQG